MQPVIWLTVAAFVAVGALVLTAKMGPGISIFIGVCFGLGALMASTWVVPALRERRLSPGFALNVVVAVTGTLIAITGLGVWATAEPDNTPLRQTVAALWLLAALLGLVITAIGVLGATILHMVDRQQ